MSCYRPLRGFRTATGVSFSELSRDDHIGSIELPCGQCIGCRMRRASDWELRVMHEASLYAENCFVTLTYGRDKLPPHGSLCHRDYQLFMKRLRKAFGGREVRFYMCGEYGPQNGRPHYHACLFNVDFDDRVPCGKSKAGQIMYSSPLLAKLWPHGFSTVQPLVRETASYCARYIMKKSLGVEAGSAYEVVTEDGEVIRKRPDYAAMSLRPGIGARWFARYSRDVFPHDICVSNGSQRRVPRYYDKLLKRSDKAVLMDAVEFERIKRAKLSSADNTDERRQVREAVHLLRVRNLLREGTE